MTSTLEDHSCSLSIIIPTFNEAASIALILSRLQLLRSNGCELIVSDGGSNDSTVAIAEPLVDHIVAGGKGRACQMNMGVDKARGKWLLFLHADTQLPDSFLSWFQQLEVSTAKWGFFPVRLSGEHFLFRVIERAISIRSRMTGVATGDQAIFVRKDLFIQIDRYPDLALMEDVALSKSLRRIARPWCYDQPVVTSSRRWEKNGILKTVLLMWLLRAAYFFRVKPNYLSRIYYKS